MECSGAETEIKVGLWQCSFLKCCNQDCECLVENGPLKEGCEAIIGPYGHRRIRAQPK